MLEQPADIVGAICEKRSLQKIIRPFKHTGFINSDLRYLEQRNYTQEGVSYEACRCLTKSLNTKGTLMPSNRSTALVFFMLLQSEVACDLHYFKPS